MRVLSANEIKKIFDDHELWVYSRHKQGAQAKLTNCSLANARSVVRTNGLNLSDAIFDCCDLDNIALQAANLKDALFSDTSLRNAWLSGANLYNASIYGCDLTNAYLDGTSLRYAHIENTKLDGTRFDGANMADSKLTLPIARLDFGGWPVTVYADETVIGCQRHSNQEWLYWTVDSPEIMKMHWRAKEWWHLYGPVVKAAILAVTNKAELTRQEQGENI
jgi:uncharacterized protein YjbI with pentapeptide repeats